jgi:hypothetical protein
MLRQDADPGRAPLNGSVRFQGIAEGLRKHQAGKAGQCWHVNESYV